MGAAAFQDIASLNILPAQQLAVCLVCDNSRCAARRYLSTVVFGRGAAVAARQ